MVDAEGRRRQVWELGRGVWNEAGDLEAVDGYVAELGADDAERPKVLDLEQMVEGLDALLGRFYGAEVALELVASGDGGRTWVDASGAERVVLKVVASGSDVVPRRDRVRLSVSRDKGSELARRTGLGLASVDVAFGEDGPAGTSEDPGDVPLAPDHRREVILLVEDDARLRRILQELLEGEGYQVLPAAGATEALAVARRAPRIDLLITDVVMPEVSGPELAERLDTLRPGLPVLYVSGYTGKAFSATTLLPPTVAFLPKPVVPGRLFEKVRQILGRG